MNCIILSEKKWNSGLANLLNKRLSTHKFIQIYKKSEFTIENIKKLNPDYILIPHWSYFIPKEIFETYSCIVFHMTDLPYGRGGSPLQNLIVRGKRETKISAIRVTEKIDAGDIYLKKELSLCGTAEEIFIRANNIIATMIEEIVVNKIKPKPQKGKVVLFKRRTPAEGNIEKLKSLKEVYNYIRMLDADGYPNAFIETDNFIFSFTRASYKADNSIVAEVKIKEK